MAVPSDLMFQDDPAAALDSSDLRFLDQAYLSYLILPGTDLDIKEEIAIALAKKQPLEEIESRSWLFFDETVDIYLILKTTELDDATLKQYSDRLLLSIQAQVINSPTPDRPDIAPASEVIHNAELENVAAPVAVVKGPVDDEEDGGGNRQPPATYTIWKASIFLTRPRLRLFGPSVVFTATASLKPGPEQLGEPQKGYLESGIAPGLNLLESFARDPMLGGVKPRLSAMRVSRVSPATQITKDSFPMLKGLANLSQKIYPAVHTRVRFSRPNTVPPGPAIIALLEIDFTPYFDHEITVDKVHLNIPDGHVEDLNDVAGLVLPLTCVAHDHLTLMYRLAPRESDVPSRKPNRELSIAIECTALVAPDTCRPRLRMAWSTVLDFTLPVNPGFGNGVTKPFSRSHRPAQLSIGDGASFVSPAVSRPDSIPSLEAATDRSLAIETPIPEFGITMTFTAQPGPIYPGDEFVWNVFVVNRVSSSLAAGSSSSTAAAAAVPTPPPRKLALVCVPRRRRNDMRIIRPPSTAGATRRKSVARPAADTDPAAVNAEVADAVLDENIVHAMQRSSLVDATEVVCLSADVRVGPLAPNACHVTELRFLALREGIVGIECVRVVDLANSEHVDIRELPVMVVERAEVV